MSVCAAPVAGADRSGSWKRDDPNVPVLSIRQWLQEHKGSRLLSFGREATGARLRWINATPAAWEDYAADRGHEELILRRDALRSVQRTLVGVLCELEALLAETPAKRRN